MASGINTVILLGNLTRDPELRTLPGSGTSLCELGLAVNENYKDRDGAWQERANFFDVVVWGAQAENCAKYLMKGRQVCVRGRLRWESWEKDGQKRSKVRVVGEQVIFLGGGDRQRDEYRGDVEIDTAGLAPARDYTPEDDPDPIPF